MKQVREKIIVCAGALCGVVGGALAVILYFTFTHIVRPNTYNIFYLSNLPAAAVFGGMLGMVIALLYVSNKD